MGRFLEDNYSDEELKQLATRNIQEFCKKLEEKGVQIIENNVMIKVNQSICYAKGEIICVEPISEVRWIPTEEIQQEGQ